MGFEACHPAVNFIFFASVIYGAVTFKHPVFLLIAYLCAFASIDPGLRSVLQLLPPFWSNGVEKELHQQ